MTILKKAVALVALVGFSAAIYAATCTGCSCVDVKGSKVCVCKSCKDDRN